MVGQHRSPKRMRATATSAQATQKRPGSPPKSVQKELSLLSTRHLRRLLCNSDSSDAETWQRP